MRAKVRPETEGPSTEDLERELRDARKRLDALEARAQDWTDEKRRLRGELRESMEKLEEGGNDATALSAVQEWLLAEAADLAELSPEDDVRHFRDPDAPQPGAQDKDPAESAAEDPTEDNEVSLVRVSLYRLPNSGGRLGSGAAGVGSSILIERTRIALTAADHRRLVDQLRGAGSPEPSVDALFDAAQAPPAPGVARFDRWSEFWRTAVPRDVHQLVRPNNLGADGYRDLVLGTPVELAATGLPVPQVAANGLRAVAAESTPDGDSNGPTATRLIRFTGAVVGLAAGRPLLADGCLKSLAHDWLSHQVSQAIAGVLRPRPDSRPGREPRDEADRMDFSSLPDRARAAKTADDIRAAKRRELWSEMHQSAAVRARAESFSVDTQAIRKARDHAQRCLDRGVSVSRLEAARQHLEQARTATSPRLAAARTRLEAERAAEWERLTSLGIRIDLTLQQPTDPDTRWELGELMAGKRRLGARLRQPVDSPADLDELRTERERIEGRLNDLRR